MASGYTAVMSTPALFPSDTSIPVLDQDKDAIFAAAIKSGSQYVVPSGNATFYWSASRGGQVVVAEQSLTLPVTTSEGTPPWAAVTVPAGTFPADDEAYDEGGLIISYRITFSGWGGACTVPLSATGVLAPGSFGTIQPPRAVNRLPTVDAFVDDMADTTFTWTVSYNKNYTVSTPIGQQSGRFEWRGDPSGETHSIALGAQTQLVVPAGTFPTAASMAQWRIAKIVMEDGASYEEELGWYPFRTIDRSCQAQAVSPVGLYLSGDEPVEFSWEHIISTGTAPTRSELQLSQDSGGSWQALANVQGDGCSVTVEAGVLPGGDLLWRVRTYNSDGVAGTWSEPAAIVVYGVPDPPVILSVSQTPRPLIRWQADEQQAYQVRAGSWDSGPLFGGAKELQVPVWLPDGACAVAVRVQTPPGYWSHWTETSVILSNTPPGTIALTAQPVENGVQLSWTAQGDFSSFELCRDGAVIASTGQTVWTDWLGAGLCSYTVRGVAGEYYALSAPVQAAPDCRCGVLTAVELIDWIPLALRRGAPPSHTVLSQRQVFTRCKPGSSLPSAEVAQWDDRMHLLEYSLCPGEESLADRLRALVGQTVLYKDQNGTRVAGVLSSLSETRGRGIDLALTIVETDWREYDEPV